MDTRERLRQQRKKGTGPLISGMTTGLVIGWGLGFLSRSGGCEGMTPHFVYTLIAFGLGGIALSVIQYLVRKNPQD